MQMSGRMDVVHLETVAGGRADQYGLRDAGAKWRADDARDRVAAVFRDEVDQHARPRQCHAVEAAAECIECAGFQARNNVGRQVLVAKRGGELAELLGGAGFGEHHFGTRDVLGCRKSRQP